MSTTDDTRPIKAPPSVARVERWLESKFAPIPALADLASYIVWRGIKDSARDERTGETMGPPAHDHFRRAALALAHELLCRGE